MLAFCKVCCPRLSIEAPLDDSLSRFHLSNWLDQGFVPEARVAGGKAVFLVLRNRRIWFSTPVTDCAIIWLTDGRWFRPNEENQQIADSILENTGLKEGYRKKLTIPIRHLFCFIESRGKSIDQISEKDLLDFISEAAKTNRNNMNIVMRAVKSVSAYLSKQQIIKI